MLIAPSLKRTVTSPVRGGTLLDGASCAAPTGLGRLLEGRDGYEHGAPAEPASARRLRMVMYQPKQPLIQSQAISSALSVFSCSTLAE